MDRETFSFKYGDDLFDTICKGISIEWNENEKRTLF